ncbi:MAG: aspartate aminotransferase family protein [SAR202 cluster bacterium]|jgi:acetylornithine/N-succinyldiaminopimelate aminotransferase|nr:aspartate aminotransferase family protein [SAR202 cluster bacterium]MEC7883988.1 aspartate aminotransferase family protein [Chloroflexota bacterium]MQG74641.1 aspartate aminotransferase family protein [SAR202 cluster bacterium]|tara:strand:- start:366 stop:1562 length:1197 start_codon:yes stop_codon:yes gene_type:complete
MATTEQWKDIESKYYMFLVRRQPMVLERGDGARVWDVDGKEYLDFTSGWAVNNVGHCNEAVADAIAEQARTLLQTSNQFYSIPQLKMAEILVENSCLDKIFICNSGAEANEGAIKLAKKYGKKNKNGAYGIITALNSFHGRTMMNVSATGQPHYQELFEPIPTGFTHVPYNDLEAIKSATNENTVAIMLEPVQGEGGVNIPDTDYLQGVRSWCDENNILLIFDEVQTGLGRLGTLFGYQSFEVEPDIITLAKGLGGGVPIGAFMAKDSACAFDPGDHGSTFGGNPLTCAAAHASTKYLIDNNVTENAAKMGEYLGEGLRKIQAGHEFITDVRGMGLLWAVEFDSDLTPEVISACNDAGLLMNPMRPNTVRLMPVLTITEAEIDEALERLEEGLRNATS